jgi:hypothetical protein
MNEHRALEEGKHKEEKKPPAIDAIKPTKFYKAKEADAEADLPPAAVTIDSSDRSVLFRRFRSLSSSFGTAEWYPVEQRNSSLRNRTVSLTFRRYAEYQAGYWTLWIRKVDDDDRKANTVTDVNESMQISAS